MRRLGRSIRFKLTVATLVPLGIAIVLCWIIGASIITNRFLAQVQQSVDTDLSSAHEILMGEVAHLADTVRLAGQSPELSGLLRDKKSASRFSLQGLLRNESLSFLSVVDRSGMIRYRAANPAGLAGAHPHGTMIGEALKGKVYSGITVLTADQAAMENSALPDQMAIALKETPRARPPASPIETRGMFMIAAAPVQTAKGEIIGVVYGGVLLNHASALPDRITRVVFKSSRGPDLTAGNATLFLDDVRIATSVLDRKGERAIGSLMSEEVYSAIGQGRTWTGRAFVLNDWYFTAYEPLRNEAGTIIGALYVGVPEKPYLQIRARFNLIFAVVLIGVTVIGIAVSAWLGRSLARPVKALEEGARRIAAGEEWPDITVPGGDELSSLAEEFNIMKQRLSDREEENQALNRTLEQKVLERTAQLEEKSQLLLSAQKELAEAERLAAVGLLASGVAHEINNPLAIIRGNAELLEMSRELPQPAREEVETILRQAGRIERIVRNLLTFSRGGSKRAVAPFSLAALLDGILDQIGHQIVLKDIEIVRAYRVRDVVLEGDEDQLRQVFTNLVVNALQAMDGHGRLTVDAYRERNQVHVTVADTGPGIPAEHREKLFTPFFSTRRDGSGLGLAVSYGIVRDHGGEIRVGEAPGTGAVFTVILPSGQGQE